MDSAVTFTPLADIILGVSILLSISFFVYGINTLHLTRRARRYSQPSQAGLTSRPQVAVHLPVYNEYYVADRLLGACARMADRYGRALVRVCVIDDSDDETRQKLDDLVRRYSDEGYRVEVLRRGTRAGFKAGALQAALEKTDERFVAVFDADFAPTEDFLDRTVPFMLQDEKVGFVQCRWTHFDRGYNMVTETIAIGIDAHFLLEQPGRWSSGYLMNFNGSAGLLRTSAIVSAGGWNTDTLAEDLDLSYRMQLSGFKPVYLKDVKVPAELPPTITSLKRQQGRWARGSIQTARKVWPTVYASKKLSFRQKFEAFVHLTYYMVHPLMVASFVLALLAVFLNVNVISYAVKVTVPKTALGTLSLEVVPWAVFTLMIFLSTISVLYYCVEAVRTQKLGILRNIKQIFLLVIIGYGISVSNSVSALSGLLSSKTGVFLRTPKYAITSKDGSWRGKKYQLPLNRETVFETIASAVGVVALVYAVTENNLGIIPILAVYVAGYLLVLVMTFSQSVTRAVST
ncbi:MAG: glycosyltransferase [Nitrososphaerota archaeon]|nr:glycosyltransferase [Nitrososphaerota archaeon]MDG6966950.1 glycosyltransferase [Nitrososphaerota archaeon]MDG6978755.1 glycosyltransferase [Nitrososphaerota archaeon]MDG7006007.1 glycosyltransferase [Nitrososphaerota archaeon]